MIWLSDRTFYWIDKVSTTGTSASLTLQCNNRMVAVSLSILWPKSRVEQSRNN
jgi:hypothetical protein